MSVRMFPVVLFGSACLWIAAAAAEEPMFPFVVSYDALPNVTNVSGWLACPAGGQGFVRSDGPRMVVGAAGDAKPIRFWATNICFEASFPTHQQAERLAARLASLGINCVRMHHMDSRSIWGDSPNHLVIDPKKIERLDYLFDQLKRRGIYTDLNLHVSRWLDRAEGFPSRDGRPEYDKGLDNFEPRMIELQKQYAHDLLTHVNPYTKTAYAREPAVAVVEINNENGLFSQWGWGRLDDLAEPYAGTFQKLWNAWLRKKYPDTAAMRVAWKAGQWPLGDELIAGGDFSRPLPGPWHMETDATARAQWSAEAAGPAGGRSLRIVVSHAGSVAWHPQISQGGLAVKKGKPYTLAFYARSEKPHELEFNCMMAHDPWEGLGLRSRVAIGKQWKQHRYTFIAERDDANARVSFSHLPPGTYELAGVSLRSGGTIGLGPNQRLEDQSVEVLRHGNPSTTPSAKADFIDFLYETEQRYWGGMYRYLKTDLGVRSLVSGTQLGYSPAGVQAGLDYIDSHSYWNHPEFPGRPWDMGNWAVRNVALVNVPGGTLADLAARRVAGMAFTVSEYNHPQPNVYAAEGLPMIAAFGAFQNWTAVFSFAYSHDTNFEPRRITSFFDVKSVTGQIVHMPACVAMFVRGDVAPARRVVTIPVSAEAERTKLHETLNSWQINATEFGLPRSLPLVHGVAMDLGKGPGRAAGNPPEAVAKDATKAASQVFVSDTGQLRWDISQPGAGYFTASTPRSKLFTGFVHGRSFDLGDVRLKIAPTRLDWATVSLVCIDGPGFDRPGRLLIAATGEFHNQGAKLRDFGHDKVTLGRDWGSEPIVCEGIAGEVILPVAADRVKCYPLDESGRRRDAAAVGQQNGRAVLRLDPSYRTVWYEVEIR